MNQISEVLSKQIEKAEALLQRVIAIPDGQPSGMVAGLINYDKSLTRPLMLDADSWEIETLEILKALYGEDSRQASGFESNTSNKHHYLKFREQLQEDLSRNITLLNALIQTVELKGKTVEKEQEAATSDKTPMVFISHSSKDKEFVDALVTLLESIGFDNTNLFCSSVPDYWIGLSQDIFESLRKLFHDHELFVLFIQSPRYFNSPVSLNEMGAAWVLKNDCCSILTKDMTREQMRGVVDGSTIFIKVDTPEAPARMNDLRNKLTGIFNLASMSDTTWERKRNTFLKAVNAIEYLPTEPAVTPLDDEYKQLQIEKLKQEAIEKKQARIRGNIVEGRSPGNRKLKIFNAGQAIARNVNVEWLNPDEEVIVQWEFGMIGEVTPQNGRSFNIGLCMGHPDTMRLRYTWDDDFQENNLFEEDVQL